MLVYNPLVPPRHYQPLALGEELSQHNVPSRQELVSRLQAIKIITHLTKGTQHGPETREAVLQSSDWSSMPADSSPCEPTKYWE